MYEGYDNLSKRLEYYESRLVASQELEGSWYDDLCPSYTIMFMNFKRTNDDKMIHRYVMRDEDALV